MGYLKFCHHLPNFIKKKKKVFVHLMKVSSARFCLEYFWGNSLYKYNFYLKTLCLLHILPHWKYKKQDIVGSMVLYFHYTTESWSSRLSYLRTISVISRHYPLSLFQYVPVTLYCVIPWSKTSNKLKTTS